MADKPLYYGSSKGTPMYYGGGQQPMYGGKGPMYYGSKRTAYGQYGAYGNYGSYGNYGGNGGNEDNSFVGKITLARMMRVIAQRWLSVFVFLLIGLIVSFTVYSISPRIFESTSEFTMDIRQASSRMNGVLDELQQDFGNNYAEIFNTRLPTWRSAEMLKRIVDNYNKEHQLRADTTRVSNDELYSVLAGSQLELQRNSRVISVAVRSRDAKLAKELADAYVEAIRQMADEDNKKRVEEMVHDTHSRAEQLKADIAVLQQKKIQSGISNDVVVLHSHRDTLNQSIQMLTGRIGELEGKVNDLKNWEALLADVQKNPENFGALASGTSRTGEISDAYKRLKTVSGEHMSLLQKYKPEHPQVIAKAQELENARQDFADATKRALATCQADLATSSDGLQTMKETCEQNRKTLKEVGRRIVEAEEEQKNYDIELKIAQANLETLFKDESELRKQEQSSNERIVPGRKAQEAQKPVLPNPILIFGIGIALSLVLGLLFVLVLDNLEDTVVNLSDIEGRLALKVLAIFPHVRRKRREHVAKFTVEEKYSQFSEAVAGLRNLLDSPRYEAMSHCLLIISTQPGEGKTITSTSVAISYAQAGRRVLHVDFDLRRPRLARIWDVELTEERSFSHTLQRCNGTTPDFAALVNHTSVENLDVICSLPPEGVTPSSIFGSSVIADFFAWARANYDRVIIDSPPYGVVGDVVSLSVLVDSVIIMCCPDRTHFKPILYCSRSLTEAGANILGVIVNDVEVSNASAFSPGQHHRYGSYGYGYGGYGYGYGYGYGPSKRSKRGDGDNPAEKKTLAAEAAAPKKEGEPEKKPAATVDNDELTDED